MHATSMRIFLGYVGDLEGFKTKVDSKLVSVCKEMNELWEMFMQFEAEQRKNLNGNEIFHNQEELYRRLLVIDQDKIKKTITQEIARAKAIQKNFQDEFEKKVYRVLHTQYVTSPIPVHKALNKEASAKTIRMLPHFGSTAHGNTAFDFEWPKEKDLLA